MTVTQIKAPAPIRKRLLVRGVVQGVGFRPFVYGLAKQYKLSGFVGNNNQGVFIEVEGIAYSVDAFYDQLQRNPPPLAHIESIQIEELSAKGDKAFDIIASKVQAGEQTLISPDLSICDDCLQELFDPRDRRYRYPFINCTNCGPRFTIIRDTPYDRPFTTMAAFPMCSACEKEYYDPLNRRFHAQPNACPECGPRITLEHDDTRIVGDDAMSVAQSLLISGHIVAIKGIGGFHLACDATNDEAVTRLRRRKGRQDKPLAIMVQDMAMARDLACFDLEEEQLLNSRERPIVLLDKRGGYLSPHIAPGNRYIGLMLPYTPLHYLLVGDSPLVMTSGNASSEPIVRDNDEALEKLAGISDAFLLHDRDIHIPCDDSVIRIVNKKELPIRRSRGYAPFPVKLPFAVPPLLAVGGELKSIFCLTSGEYAFMSQHIGDMENLETLQAFTQASTHLKTIFHVEPQGVVCDQHPHYLSTSWASTYSCEQDVPLFKVQHHHAHIASVMAENRVTEPVIGFAYDGTGYGSDGAIWGSEVMISDYQHYERVAHLSYMPMSGGDSAVKNPYRLALAYLWASGIAWDDDLPPVRSSTSAERRILKRQLERNINVVQTSSKGRLFDVIAALIGLRQKVTYEAQAAIELEAIAVDTRNRYQTPPNDVADLLYQIVIDLRKGISGSIIATKFHNWVAEGVILQAIELRAQYGIYQVALSGGVFQNTLLLTAVLNGLHAEGFEIHTHRLVPPNDSGLALGQAMIASQYLQGVKYVSGNSRQSD